MSRLSLSEHAFRRLVALLPEEQRGRYGRDMRWLFRDQLREARRKRLGVVRLWARVLPGMLKSIAYGFATMITADVADAVRAISRDLSFSIISIVTLGVGVGATTAIFSVVSGVLLRPLPYPEPDQLVTITAFTDTQPDARLSLSPEELEDLRERTRTFGGVAAVWHGTITVSDAQPMEQVQYAWATHDFLPTLGVTPARGRWFLPEEEAAERAQVAVISHEYWRVRYGGSSDVLGRTIDLQGTEHEIVGVLPASFRVVLGDGVSGSGAPAVWVPQYAWGGRRSWRWLYGIARLAPGATMADANTELGTLAAEMGAEHEEYAATGIGFVATSIAEDTIGEVRPSLYLLFGAVVFVLAIACSNITNMLLARLTVRHAEFATRRALGAGPGRILRQVLTENVVLSAFGGLLGIGVAYLGVDILHALGPAHLPRLDEVRVDAGVLAFAILLALFTGLIVGIVPAIGATRDDLAAALRRGSRTSTGRWANLRGGLVLTQVAVALVLLTGATLLGRSFVELGRVELGFDPARIATLRVPVGGEHQDSPREYAAFYRRMQARVAGMSGVDRAAAISVLPLSSEVIRGPYAFDARSEANLGTFEADYRVVTPGYFETMGIRLLVGSDFDWQESDRTDLPLIVDESLAQTAWPGRDPIGRRLAINVRTPGIGQQLTWGFVRGVVNHTRQDDVRRDGFGQVYVPAWTQVGAEMALVVRATEDAEAILAPVQESVEALGPNRAVHTLRTLEAYVADATAENRYLLALVALFATIAITVSTIGIYSALTYDVSSRTREIGVRSALGAGRITVIQLVLGRAMALTIGGIALGLFGAAALTRFLEGMLYGVSPMDPVSLATVSVGFLAIACISSLAPALRAGSVAPVEALRNR